MKELPSPPKLTRQNATCHISPFDLDDPIENYPGSPSALRYNIRDILYSDNAVPHPLDLNFNPFQADVADKEETKAPPTSPTSSPTVDLTSEPEPPSVTPEPQRAPSQSLTDGFRSVLHTNIHIPTMLESFQRLAQVLLDMEIGNCRGYHSTLNDWLSARLSRVTAAQMMVRFFANDRQVCFIFQEIQDHGLINRHIRSCMRSYQRIR